jgi:hypothetical protein
MGNLLYPNDYYEIGRAYTTQYIKYIAEPVASHLTTCWKIWLE